MTSGGKCVRALIPTILASMRSVHIHVPTWNTHTLEFTLNFSKARSGTCHWRLWLRPSGQSWGKVYKEERKHIQAWDPELVPPKKQCSQSFLGLAVCDENHGLKTQQTNFWAWGYWGPGPQFYPRGWKKAILFNSRIQHSFWLLVLSESIQAWRWNVP